jgi:hypothetical protein
MRKKVDGMEIAKFKLTHETVPIKGQEGDYITPDFPAPRISSVKGWSRGALRVKRAWLGRIQIHSKKRSKYAVSTSSTLFGLSPAYLSRRQNRIIHIRSIHIMAIVSTDHDIIDAVVMEARDCWWGQGVRSKLCKTKGK